MVVLDLLGGDDEFDAKKSHDAPGSTVNPSL
jgi:hypothetical protein